MGREGLRMSSKIVCTVTFGGGGLIGTPSSYIRGNFPVSIPMTRILRSGPVTLIIHGQIAAKPVSLSITE